VNKVCTHFWDTLYIDTAASWSLAQGAPTAWLGTLYWDGLGLITGFCATGFGFLVLYIDTVFLVTMYW
jgi:hypothetical protein